ncbi:TPA: hypothetical protein ACT5B2_000139 [Burkholderia cenocepacia]
MKKLIIAAAALICAANANAQQSEADRAAVVQAQKRALVVALYKNQGPDLLSIRGGWRLARTDDAYIRKVMEDANVTMQGSLDDLHGDPDARTRDGMATQRCLTYAGKYIAAADLQIRVDNGAQDRANVIYTQSIGEAAYEYCQNVAYDRGIHVEPNKTTWRKQ